MGREKHWLVDEKESCRNVGMNVVCYIQLDSVTPKLTFHIYNSLLCDTSVLTPSPSFLPPLPASLTAMVGLCTSVCSTTQYLSVNLPSFSISSSLTSLPSSLCPNLTANSNRMPVMPTGAVLSTPSVPLKSKSPSAVTVPEAMGMPRAVATAFRVTPEQATRASRSMSKRWHTRSAYSPHMVCTEALLTTRA